MPHRRPRTPPENPRHLRHSLVLLPLALLAHMACFNAGIPVRPADLPAPDHLAGNFQVPIVTYAGGQVTTSDGHQSQGNSGQRALIHPMGVLILPYLNATGWLSVGLSDWAALGISVGLQQLGGDVRVALLDEDSGSSASLTLNLGAAYRPWIEADKPWMSLGFDLSRHAASTVAFANLYASFGPENHAMGLDETQSRDCGSFGEEGCGEYGPPRHFAFTQDELRLHLALGLGPLSEEDGVQSAFTVSLVGYWLAWADEPTRSTCVGCSYLDPVSLTERFGVSLVVGATFTGIERQWK